MESHEYDDIINLPHHQSKTHKPMSREDRAAQFAPFAALTGHGDALRETERLTEEKRYIDKINECITKYEEENGITVNKAAITFDRKFDYTYSNLPNNTFTTRGILPAYSRIHTLNYYTNRKLELVQMNRDIYQMYFANKDFKEFGEEQVKFSKDTVNICVY